MDDALIDPQYLEMGDNSLIAAGTRIHTHDIINKKLYIKKVTIGKNVIIGIFAHIQPGVEIADGSIVGIMAWLEGDQKCEPSAIWLGKPASALPISILSKSTRFQEKHVD